MGQGTVGGGEEPMEMGQGAIGGGEGDLRDVVILWLQTRLTVAEVQLEDKDAEIVARDVQLFAWEAELTVVVRERDDAVDRVRELQDRVRVVVGVQGQGPTWEVLRDQEEIDY